MCLVQFTGKVLPVDVISFVCHQRLRCQVRSLLLFFVLFLFFLIVYFRKDLVHSWSAQVQLFKQTVHFGLIEVHFSF